MKFLLLKPLFFLLLIQFGAGSDLNERPRTWTNLQGKTLMAKLISYDDNNVTIFNGKKNYTLPINSFSPEDISYLESVKQSTGYSHLIITSKKFASIQESPNLTELSERRTKQGLKSKIVTVTDIKKSIKAAGSTEEKIKAFIRREREKNGIEYVFLCGSDSIIPAIIDFPTFLEETKLELAIKGLNGVPSDMHYACFNLNEGQSTFDVHLGRLPTSDKKELSNYLNKLFEYEDRSTSELFSRAFVFTAKQDGIGSGYAKSIEQKLLKKGVGSNHIVYAHREPKDLLEGFKAERFGFSYAAGHGTRDDLCSFRPDYFRTFKGEDYHTFVLSSLACLAGDFSAEENMAKEVLCGHPQFGAVAAFLNSRVAFGGKFGQNFVQNREKDARFENDLKTVGKIASYSREKIADLETESEAEYQSKWFTTLEHNLFGDPALVWRTE